MGDVIGVGLGRKSLLCALFNFVSVCECHPLLRGFVVALFPLPHRPVPLTGVAHGCVVPEVSTSPYFAQLGSWCRLVPHSGYLVAHASLGRCFVVVVAWADTLLPLSLLSRGYFATYVSGRCFATVVRADTLSSWSGRQDGYFAIVVISSWWILCHHGFILLAGSYCIVVLFSHRLNRLGYGGLPPTTFLSISCIVFLATVSVVLFSTL